MPIFSRLEYEELAPNGQNIFTSHTEQTTPFDILENYYNSAFVVVGFIPFSFDTNCTPLDPGANPESSRTPLHDCLVRTVIKLTLSLSLSLTQSLTQQLPKTAMFLYIALLVYCFLQREKK